VGLSRAALEARVRELELAASREFERHAATVEPKRSRPRSPETPDAVGTARRRGRRGEMP
jgi:hypothetical protein